MTTTLVEECNRGKNLLKKLEDEFKIMSIEVLAEISAMAASILSKKIGSFENRLISLIKKHESLGDK